MCENEYEGYVFDKIERHDGLFQYIVYLVELKTVSRINLRHNIENYSKNKFKVFIFNDEASLKKKIRIHLIEKNKNSKNSKLKMINFFISLLYQ